LRLKKLDTAATKSAASPVAIFDGWEPRTQSPFLASELSDDAGTADTHPSKTATNGAAYLLKIHTVPKLIRDISRGGLGGPKREPTTTILYENRSTG
jgi:hypothetical protein